MKKIIPIADKKIIEKIVTVKQWNKEATKDQLIPCNYGYVMPLFHGWEWKRTKKELISKYTFS